MTPNHFSDKQRGFLLITALGSLLVVGTVAAGLNVLIVQDAGTPNNKLLVTRDTIFADSAFLFVRDKLEEPPESVEPVEPVELNDDGLLLDDGTREESPTRAQLREALSKAETEDVRIRVRDVYTYIFAEQKLEDDRRFDDEGGLLDEDREDLLDPDPDPEDIVDALSSDDREDVDERIQNLLDRRLPIPD